MKQDYESKYHDIEDRQWWFKTRREYILDYVKNLPKDAKILDIGCSSGLLMKELIELGFKKENLYGVDISEKAIGNCHLSGLNQCYVMDAQNITLQQNYFDILISSDCLEHLEQDETALNNWRRLLKDNGLLLVFVPAFMSLWSKHDVANMHYRRYTLKELKNKTELAGFNIVKKSYWNFALYFPTFVYRTLSRKLSKEDKNASGDLMMPSAPINFFLTKLVSLENYLLRYIDLPLGVSTFCVAKATPGK